MTTKQTHTKGPWTWADGKVYCQESLPMRNPAALRTDRRLIANCLVGIFPDEIDLIPQAQANARLIAASPTMYEYVNRKASEGDTEAKAILERINALPGYEKAEWGAPKLRRQEARP